MRQRQNCHGKGGNGDIVVLDVRGKFISLRLCEGNGVALLLVLHCLLPVPTCLSVQGLSVTTMGLAALCIVFSMDLATGLVWLSFSCENIQFGVILYMQPFGTLGIHHQPGKM